MNSPSTLFSRKVIITGKLTFDTAFHIGSGKEGELATNMGILKEPDGRPILPGSSLKGSFRAFAERLAGHLKLTSCLLDPSLSRISCVSDNKTGKEVRNKLKEKKFATEAKRIGLLASNTCDVCALFGSPLKASRIFFSDGKLDLDSWARSIQVRDGVCIDRDTETARPGAKYDFEVVPEGACFRISIELENPTIEDLALVEATLVEWENGFRLGGFTSRGLGRVHLTERKVRQVDYTDADQLKAYLRERTMSDAGDLLGEGLSQVLERQGGSNA